ncbi:MAG TPA: hypothetical protein VHM70_14255 [Polyangiaceae bacterium]|jgi:protein-S-isoprenylcysteine O-methyltransferase Ste14|nr:hypothetical protein [Polyangiaceae bacterium]
MGIDNVIAALLLSMAAMRRLEVLGVDRAFNAHVSDTDFTRWRQMALSAYNTVAVASLAKVLLSFGWFYVFAKVDLWLQIGGLLIFIAWVITLVWAWRQATEASALRDELGIRRKEK